MTRPRTQTHLLLIIKRTSCRNGSLTIWTAFWRYLFGNLKLKFVLLSNKLNILKCFQQVVLFVWTIIFVLLQRLSGVHKTSQLMHVFYHRFFSWFHPWEFGQINTCKSVEIHLSKRAANWLKIFQLIWTLIKAHLVNAN